MRKHLLCVLSVLLASTLGWWAVPAPASASVCRSPKWVTTDPDGMWIRGRYIVHNNMWNASDYRMRQRLSACSPRNWRVVAVANNRSGDGAVKSYPNVHRDYWGRGDGPRVTSFRLIRSHWAARTPRFGIYNAAYDIWLDGLDHEVMIWTHNRRQVPSGSRVARNVKIGRYRWTVWGTRDDSYNALVPRRKLDHGTVAIKQTLDWLMRHHRLDRDVRLGQIGFGFEIVSTAGHRARFKVDDFSVTSRRRR